MVEKLLAKESLFEAIFQNLHVCVAFMDTEFNFIRVNEAYAATDGKRPADMVGKNHFALYPHAENERIFRRVLATGEAHHEYAKPFEYEYHSERGATYWDWTLAPFVDAAGAVGGVLLTLIDVTPRVNAELQLKHAQHIGRVGIWEWDIKRDRVDWSDEVFRIFGSDKQAFDGTYEGLLALVHPEDRERVVATVTATLAERREYYEIEHRLQVPGIGERHVWGQGRLYVDGDGEPARLIGTVQDITERKRAVSELERYRHDLEALVEARTRELTKAQEDLVQADRLATLGRLTATVGHELRNPMNSMLASIHVLRKACTQDNDRVVRALEVVERNCQRSNRIIDELLDFSRSRAKPRYVALDIDRFLAELLREDWVPREINRRLEPGLHGASCRVDPDQIRRVMINLINNACDAVREGDGPDAAFRPDARLTIATGCREGVLEIRCADNGRGMTPDEQARVFEPMFSTKSFGIGLGMVEVRNIMERHQGEVRIESAPGAGTTVTLRFPCTPLTEV